MFEKMSAFTTEEGSRRLVWAAVGSPEDPNSLRGQYIDCCVVQEASDFVIGKDGTKVENDVWVSFLSSSMACG